MASRSHFLSSALRALLTLCLLACAGCSTKAPSVPAYPELPVTPPAVERLQREQRALEREMFSAAQKTFEQRCVVCHGCYDAPCQLVLSSFEGVARGANKKPVYDGSRLLAAEPTRLFIDARDVPSWREKGFFSVIPERPMDEPGQSLLVRMLELKRKNPLPHDAPFPRGFELGLDREAVCPTSDEFEEYASEHPSWGMPYALPGLNHREHDQLLNWVQAGTPHAPLPALPPAVLDAIERWEDFLNQPALKPRLMARYLYEHLFLASLYFEDASSHAVFRLVRSRTKSGDPVDEIATRRPFDDPGDGPFYYRFLRQQAAVLAKTHMPYALSDARMERWRELFLTPTYMVDALPSYAPEVAANPFRAFHALPVASRYRFMLDEAEFTMMGFIKGPVCRGQVALDVIQDRFWVSFVDPDSPVLSAEDAFLASVTEHLDLPAEDGSNGRLLNWLRYARNEKQYLEHKSKFLSKLAGSSGRVDLSLVWDGDGKNPNAALTVFRHFDSATVMKGFVGGPPKTAWLVGYPVLERIHYLLVAGFDVFGNIGHQLNTRMYMDFLRMESESNFLMLLPKSRRRALVDAWYRDVSGEVKDEVYGKLAHFDRDTDIAYKTQQPEFELFAMMAERMSSLRENRRELAHVPEIDLRAPLQQLSALVGMPASLMPETSFLEVRGPVGDPQYFTILRDSSHTNVAHLFRESERRVPQEDELSVLSGFVGAYPNALFSVERAELSAFLTTVRSMQSHEAYELFHARFGVSRTSHEFWPLMDRLHAAYRRLSPLEAGLFDLNRLDGR